MKDFFNALDKLAMQNKKKPKKPVFISVHLMEWVGVRFWDFTKE